MRLHSALAAAALALGSTNLLAYQIIGSHYHVEIEPNKFIDQLVLRCEDGKEVTVPWQSKLAESCGEDLMGNVTRNQPKKAVSAADEPQKQTMLKQTQGHNTVPEQEVGLSSGPDASSHFAPPMVEILKKYEVCRKTHKDKAYCATERDRAMAALSDAPAAAVTDEPAPPLTPAKEAASTTKEMTPATMKKAPRIKRAQAPASQPRPAATEEPRGEVTAVAAASTPASIATPAPAEAPATPTTAPAAPGAEQSPSASTPAAKPTDAETRASAERKISEEFATCMRNKPKLECEQARSKAMADLDRPARPAKPARSRKHAARDVATQPVAAK